MVTKESYIGRIPQEWMECSWDEVLEGFKTGITPSRKYGEYFKGNIQWFTSGELKKHYICHSIERISDRAVADTNIVIYPAGTFVMAIIGLEAEGTRGSCALLGASGAINQSCVAVTGTEKLSSEYLYYFYSQYGTKLDLEFCQGTKQQNLSSDIVKRLPICFPPNVTEQNEIVQILSDVDELIVNLEKLIEKKKAIKQGTMQDLLTGKKRLPGFNDEWKEHALSDYAECIRGVSYDGSRDVFLNESDNTIRLLRSNNIQDAQFVNRGIQYVRRSRASEKQLIRQGDIMVCMANGSKSLVGKSCYFGKDMHGLYSFGAFMSVVRLLNIKDGAKYIFYLMNSDTYWKNIALLLSGSSINNLRPGDILGMVFKFPDKDERDAITKVLDDMENEIIDLENKLVKYRQIKHGMMQKLLTGQIRLA